MGERTFKFMYKRKDLTNKRKTHTHTHTHATTHNLAFQMKSFSEKYSREKTESGEYSQNVVSPQNESNLAEKQTWHTPIGRLSLSHELHTL